MMGTLPDSRTRHLGAYCCHRDPAAGGRCVGSYTVIQAHTPAQPLYLPRPRITQLKGDNTHSFASSCATSLPRAALIPAPPPPPPPAAPRGPQTGCSWRPAPRWRCAPAAG